MRVVGRLRLPEVSFLGNADKESWPVDGSELSWHKFKLETHILVPKGADYARGGRDF
jgi:hypothetical protein